MYRSSQQAMKQSTKVLGGNAWGRPAAVPSSSNTGTAGSGGGSAWGPLQTGAPPFGASKPAPWASVASGVASSPSGGSSTVKPKDDPIDYFEMTN